jgi:hypothetical protein
MLGVSVNQQKGDEQRGKERNVNNQAGEADQEANISKRFLAAGESTAGAADQRHRQLNKTMMNLPVPANQSKLHFAKHPQPAD